MKNGKYHNSFRLNDKEYSVWKTAKEHPPDVSMDDLIVLGILVGLLYRLIEFIDEPVS